MLDLIQLHPDNVEVVAESVTFHTEHGAGTKKNLHVGQKEEEDKGEEGGEEEGRGGDKPHHPHMISSQQIGIGPGKGKAKTEGSFPQPFTHNTRHVCIDDLKTKVTIHSLCDTREWGRGW